MIHNNLSFVFPSFTHDIEAVSCDEMFIDLTELLNTCQASPEDFASLLRSEIQVMKLSFSFLSLSSVLSHISVIVIITDKQ